MTDHRRIAARTLAKCAAYDPWFPSPAEAIVTAWTEHLQLDCNKHLTEEDMLAGVTAAYRDNGNGFKPLPKDITDAARKIRADRAQRALPTAEYQALCDAKAGEHLLNDDGTVALEPRPATADARRRAIEEFASRVGRADRPANQTRTRELVERQRAAAPPQPLNGPDTTTASAEGHDWQPVTDEDVR